MQKDIRVQIVECFQTLQQSLYNLAATLYQDSKLPIWLSDSSPSESTRQNVYHIINQLEYTDAQAPRSTVQQPGLVGASNETLAAVQQVNIAKDEFKTTMQLLKNDKKLFLDHVLQQSLDDLLQRRHANSQTGLHRSGLSRLHLKQCYRHIPVLNLAPEKVSWTWAHTRAIKRITIAQAEAALLKKHDLPGIQLQLKKLRDLPRNEPLAIVQQLAPHIRANIVTKLDNGMRQRHMIPGALPIFYPAAINSILPSVGAAGAKVGKNPLRLNRCDQKLDTEVFLPALRAYRYIE